MITITRQQAKESGLKRYFTGEPCKRGHIAERHVSGATCVKCAADRYEKNRDELLQINKEWSIANPEKRRQSKKRYHDKNKGKARERQRRYAKENPEKISEKRKRYREKNKEKFYAAIRAYQKSNPHVVIAAINRRRAAKLKATPAWADYEKIKEIYRMAKEKGMHVDHVYPLQGKLVCGLHVHQNLQIIAPVDNRRKSNKMPDEINFAAKTQHF